MTTAAAPQLGVCREYRTLLEDCQRALVRWQQRRTHAERTGLAGPRASEELKQLQTTYAHACAALEQHEQTCTICQYVSKVAGLDFESLASVVNGARHRY
jgi:hypothetical protein